jgi:hypothetical protein
MLEIPPGVPIVTRDQVAHGKPDPDLLSGGYGLDGLQAAGAYGVYKDPADLLRLLDEVGVRVNDSD